TLLSIGASTRSIVAHANTVYGAAFAPRTHVVVTAGSDGAIRAFDADSAKTTTGVARHEGIVEKLSGGTELVATMASDHRVRLWDAIDAVERAGIDIGPRPVGALALAADDKHVAAARDDGSVEVWDATSGTLARKWVDTDVRARALAFAASGTRL